MVKNFVVNGEIYVKNGPTSIEDIIYDLEFEISCRGYDQEKISKLDFYKKYKEKLDGFDYCDTNCFFQLATNGQEFQLNRCEKDTDDEIKILSFSSKEELEKEFTSLYDFLNIATFVGKFFYRTTPIFYNSIVDKSYIYNEKTIKYLPRYIILYATQDLFLAKEIDNKFNEIYVLIDSRYTLDGNYAFYGKVFDEYKDKNKVYCEILEQIKRDKQNSKGLI